MEYIIRAMTRVTASKIVNWHYEAPYGDYNLDGDMEEAEAMLDHYHFSVHDQDLELLGFYCFGASAQVPSGRLRGFYMGRRILDIGLGLRPDLTGKGLGPGFVRAGLDFGIRKWQPRAIRLTVAVENARAIKVYQRLGFSKRRLISARSPRGWRDYYIMLLPRSRFAKKEDKKGRL